MRTRRVLKPWVKYLLASIVIVTSLTLLLKINGKMEKDFVSNCESLGYSYNYCVAHS